LNAADPLLVLVALFVTIAVARLRGLLALIGLGVTAAVVVDSCCRRWSPARARYWWGSPLRRPSCSLFSTWPMAFRCAPRQHCSAPSEVWELREAAPGMKPRRLYHTAMRIGRDHIASTKDTIVFAYAGAALPVLLLIDLYGRPLGNALTASNIAEELVRTMASAIGLVLAVPLTTALAVATVGQRNRGNHRRVCDCV